MSGETSVFEGVESLVSEVGELDGVEASAPVLFSPGMIVTDVSGTPGYAELHGIDPADHARVILGETGEADPFLLLEAGTESGRPPILLGAELASRVGALPGTLVQAVVPKMRLEPWGARPRSRLFEVVGTYKSRYFQEDSQRAYLLLEDARRLVAAPRAASWVEVRIDDLDRLGEMRRSLSDGLGETWLVIDLIEQNKPLFAALQRERLLLFMVIGLIVVVAALNIVSTLILMVNDKIKEIGTLSAMGARSSSIAWVFVLQGLIIGAVGTVAGLAAGTAISAYLNAEQVIQLDPEVYFFSYVPFHTRPQDLVAVGVAALVISLLATIYPALKASRLDPVEAIRYE
jgi:lipoprotein-releasing system permease protein